MKIAQLPIIFPTDRNGFSVSSRLGQDLTQGLIAYLREKNHFVTQLPTVSQYRAKLGVYAPALKRTICPHLIVIAGTQSIHIEISPDVELVEVQAAGRGSRGSDTPKILVVGSLEAFSQWLHPSTPSAVRLKP
ncbi:hypothetical protein F5984_15195 [Rudanella paleaurantiibacter]|uniref:Uncharacterized protein n=1 Tax=Rudanella paleaurantiibacter TaxID=2614655 RepID=A0A7J5TZD8_9BACT|nr:hypothetical protein [Rudanella paleaurantiibacter]KAB7730486.1 hypothetical protein F5984_15195 [Rudanella paleaurantiibacter]